MRVRRDLPLRSRSGGSRQADGCRRRGRVRTWPVEAKREAVATLRAIEADWIPEDYRASPEELEAIDEADRSGVASEEEVEYAFKSFRTA
jgi:hypothetical protein